MDLLSLPSETFEHILHLLPPEELLQIQRIDKGVQRFIFSSPKLRASLFLDPLSAQTITTITNTTEQAGPELNTLLSIDIRKFYIITPDGNTTQVYMMDIDFHENGAQMAIDLRSRLAKIEEDDEDDGWLAMREATALQLYGSQNGMLLCRERIELACVYINGQYWGYLSDCIWFASVLQKVLNYEAGIRE